MALKELLDQGKIKAYGLSNETYRQPPPCDCTPRRLTTETLALALPLQP